MSVEGDQSMTPTDPSPKSRHSWLATILPLLAAVGFCVWLGYGVYDGTRSVVPGRFVDSQLDEQGHLRPLSEVVRLTRAMRLVTVTVDTTVTSKAENRNWRGSARASVTAPVRYSYGVDLSQMSEGMFRLLRLVDTYVLTIPRPERIAVEVDMKHATKQVEVTAGRFRALSGETQLEAAREKVRPNAQRQALAAADMKRVEQDTLDRVRELVQKLVGDATVKVHYK